MTKQETTEAGPDRSREVRPETAEALWEWVRDYTGIAIARTPVCPGHQTPWDFFRHLFFDRPSLVLALGARGAGKSFLAALDTHLKSRWDPGHATRVLGGSLAQSEQVYRALRAVVSGRGPRGTDGDTIERLLKGASRYRNGSEVAILAASSTSVRGPHVPSLVLDEVDEIETDLREAAMGMCMATGTAPASVVMTSTWHRLGGPMSALIDQADAGDFRLFTFCAFEVLERCPEERSGPHLEKCPECPLFKYCHNPTDGGPPLAKRSNGHYTIDSLIQKVRSVSARTFEADYLCRGPKADGIWFPTFDPALHVATRAEYDPALRVHLAIDSGVFTGAVFFQVAPLGTPGGVVEEVRVFADYLATGKPAEVNARAILEVARTRCNGRLDVATTDPSGGARNAIGPTVIAEYERSGLRPLRRWPVGSVADGLALLESFIQPAEGRPRLVVHPRCGALIRALQNYRRARRGGQWQDYPEDPQHPSEDLVDALRGGLRACYPEGRRPEASYTRVPARQVF